jgi:radical SAM protein with 4Fe4S-binding SPASM domain
VRPAISIPRLVHHGADDLGRHLFFNPASARFAVTDPAGARIIEDYLRLRTKGGAETRAEGAQGPPQTKKPVASVASSGAFIDELAQMGILACAEDSQDYGRVPERLIIELTTACNLRCKTCYVAASRARESELSTQEVKELLREAACSGTASVAFLGGEPFMKPDLIDLVEAALDRFSDVQVSTNGTRTDHAFLQRFAGVKGLTLQVSLDGPDQASNDAIRGKGSFTKALGFLNLARQLGLRTSISSVLNRCNYNLVGGLCDFALDQGCVLAIFHKVHIFGRAEEFPEIIPSQAQLMHGMGVLLQKFCQYEGPGRMKVDFPHNRCFRGDPALDASYLGCHFGRAFAYVTSQGDLVCCSHLQNGQFNYGNVRKKGLIELWQTSPGLDRMRHMTVDDIPSCRQCQFKYMCRGSCRADALGSSGRLQGQPHDCDALRSYYAYVLDYYLRETEVTTPRRKDRACSS